MKKSKITGWKDVYEFTIAQNIKNKSYIISTIVITLFVAALCVCINLLPAIVFDTISSSNQKEAEIGTAYLYDHSGLSKIDYSGLLEMAQIPDDMVLIETDSAELTEEMASKDKVVLAEIAAVKDGYEVSVTIPEQSEVSNGNADTLATAISQYFREVHCNEMEITQEQIAFMDLPVNTSVTMTGEEATDFVALFVEYFVNVALVLVFMLLINSYGKMTASVVAMEKSSKVMELLLTSVKPVATIVGKVLAMSTLLLGQIVLWIVVGTASYFGSNAILGSIDSKYSEGLGQLLDMLKSAGIEINLSPVIILLSILIIVTGFTVYIAIAGFIGATVGKIEELGQSIQTFSFLAIAGAYLPLFGFINMISSGMADNPLLNVSRVLPISSLYLIPSEMILGSNTISSGLIAFGINLGTLVLLMLFVSKVYESVILYSGNRLKLKDIIKMSRNK